MIDDKRMSVLDRLIAQGDFLKYRPHLFASTIIVDGIASCGWICRYVTKNPIVYGYGLGLTMKEAYESARDHWRAEEERVSNLRLRFKAISKNGNTVYTI